MKRFSLLPLLFLAACSSNQAGNASHNSTGNQTDTTGKKTGDTTYVRTGFYFLAEAGQGIRMSQEHADAYYTIDPVPFASVDHINKTKLEKTHLKEGDYAELCMTFDEKGTTDLAAGTGNIMHPKIAAVVANKLLFVVDNTTSIKTGIMCVGLVGYSEEEMQAMRNAVNSKK